MKALDYLRIIFRYSSRPDFIITIKNGIAVVSSGKVPEKLVSEFSSIAKNENIWSGIIYGIKDNNRIVLEFSSSISGGDCQRFRNTLNSL